MDRIEQFAAALTKRGKSPPTVDSYRNAARRFEDFLKASGAELSSPYLLQKFVDHLGEVKCRDYRGRTKAFSPNSIALFCSGAGYYLRFLREQGLEVATQEKPDRPSRRKLEPFALDEQPLARYQELAGEQEEPYRSALRFAPYVGARVSELCALRKSDLSVDDAGVLTVTILGKGNKERRVQVMAEGHDVLGEYLSSWRVHNYPDSPWLFPSLKYPERHIDACTLSRKNARLRTRLGTIRPVTIHTLRKTYATRLLARGVALPVISDLLGHSSLTVTERYFDRTVAKKAALRDAAAVFVPED